MRARQGLWFVIASALVMVGGCGKKIDRAKLESSIAEALTKKLGSAPKSVTCPDTDGKKKGETFACTADVTEGTATITVTVLENSAVEWKITGVGK